MYASSKEEVRRTVLALREQEGCLIAGSFGLAISAHFEIDARTAEILDENFRLGVRDGWRTVDASVVDFIQGRYDPID
jgi:hypothetical protein